MRDFDYEQAEKDGITTVVEVISQGEWPPEIINNLKPVKVELLLDTGSFMIHRLHCKQFADREELKLLRAVFEHEICTFTSIGL